MKLYTENQIRDALDNEDFTYIANIVIAQMQPIELPSDEELAILFHNKYEELAPKFQYETRKDTKTFNKETDNGKLMIAACREILQILNQNK